MHEVYILMVGLATPHDEGEIIQEYEITGSTLEHVITEAERIARNHLLTSDYEAIEICSEAHSYNHTLTKQEVIDDLRKKQEQFRQAYGVKHTRTIEIKRKLRGHFQWEKTPVWRKHVITAWTTEGLLDKAEEIMQHYAKNQPLFVQELRWNWEGSTQGNYVANKTSKYYTLHVYTHAQQNGVTLTITKATTEYQKHFPVGHPGLARLAYRFTDLKQQNKADIYPLPEPEGSGWTADIKRTAITEATSKVPTA